MQLALEGNAQKSDFITNIGTQITPSLNIIDEHARQTAVPQSMHRHIKALKQLMEDLQTYIRWKQRKRSVTHQRARTQTNFAKRRW